MRYLLDTHAILWYVDAAQELLLGLLFGFCLSCLAVASLLTLLGCTSLLWSQVEEHLLAFE